MKERDTVPEGQRLAARESVIYLPPKKGVGHAQLMLDIPGVVFNVIAKSEADVLGLLGQVEAAAAAGKGLTFRSPHDAENHYLTAGGVKRIMAVCVARTEGEGVTAEATPAMDRAKSRIVRLP